MVMICPSCILCKSLVRWQRLGSYLTGLSAPASRKVHQLLLRLSPDLIPYRVCSIELHIHRLLLARDAGVLPQERLSGVHSSFNKETCVSEAPPASNTRFCQVACHCRTSRAQLAGCLRAATTCQHVRINTSTQIAPDEELPSRGSRCANLSRAQNNCDNKNQSQALGPNPAMLRLELCWVAG